MAFSSGGGQAGSSNKGEIIESVVCKDSDIKENEMKVFDINKEGGQVLIVKQHGKVYAVGNKCTHYGAPLVNGALGEGRLRCPWHGACFNLETGDIEDFPGLDGIPRYECEILRDGGVKVKAYKSQLKENKVPRLNNETIKINPKPSQTFVIIGGGPAGNNCAETLRHQGFQGRIVMVSGEQYLPYDRIKLSKVLNVDPGQIALRSQLYYDKAGIELKLNTKAKQLNVSDKLVLLSDDSQIGYDKVFIATGSRPRTIKLPGFDLKNVFTLRNIEDAQNIHKELGLNKNLVVVGSSFIGMEVASYCVGKVKSVTVIGKSLIPFENTLGSLIGKRLMELFLSKGVNFIMNNTVEKYTSKSGGKVSEVHLEDGRILPADIVVVGLGAINNTEYLADSKINLKTNGSIPVNEFLETNVKGVYAGGDIAYAPVFANNNKSDAIGHWQLAHYHGYIAAFNMLGNVKPLQSVPFFWTVLFGMSIRYAGVGSNYNDVVLTGDLNDMKFAAYYCEGDEVNAIITAGRDPLASKFAELLANNKRLKKNDVNSSNVGWMDKRISVK